MFQSFQPSEQTVLYSGGEIGSLGQWQLVGMVTEVDRSISTN